MRSKEELLEAIESAEKAMEEDRNNGMDILEVAHKYEYLAELRKELNAIWAEEALYGIKKEGVE